MAVPLFADALAVTKTLPDAPEAHCTVAVPGPVETIVAIVVLDGLLTTNWPLYGAPAGSSAGVGGRLNDPVAVKRTCPSGNVCASAVVGATLTDKRTRPILGLLDPQESKLQAAAIRNGIKQSGRLVIRALCVFGMSNRCCRIVTIPAPSRQAFLPSRKDDNFFFPLCAPEFSIQALTKA